MPSMPITPTPRFLAAVDQCTTSTRFMLFDRHGEVLVCAQRKHAQSFPAADWVEHDPREILRNTLAVTEEGFEKAGITCGEIACLGIANQRETVVVWDRHTGEPAYSAIFWQDTRVADAVAQLVREGVEAHLRERCGLPLSTYFSALKIVWILDHMPNTRACAELGDLLFGNIDAFLLWHFMGGTQGGVHATDVTNASRTQLMHLATCDWNEEALALFRIPRAMLPAIRSSSEIYGKLARTSLRGLPIDGLLGDQQAALVGQTCLRPDDSKNTYGTGYFLLMNTGTESIASKAGPLTTLAYHFRKAAPVYALEGSVAGALVQWLRDNLGLIASSNEIESLARSVEYNDGVYFVPAFSGLYAPYGKDTARGVIAGLTRFANKGHLFRAVLEATALQTVDAMYAMESDSGIVLRELRTGGGMVGNELLMQVQADLLGCAVLRPRETTALGAAYAAGLACGFYTSPDELAENWSVEKQWESQISESERDRHFRRCEKAISRSFDWEDSSVAG